MAEECWRVICDESSAALGVDGVHLHAALMAERVAFWADPEIESDRPTRTSAGEPMIVARAFSRLGIADEDAAAVLARLYRERRDGLVQSFPRRSRPSRRFGPGATGWR